jgi:ketosteroid isomerase-like protein
MTSSSKLPAPNSGKGYGYLELLLVLTVVVALVLVFGRSHTRTDNHAEQHVRELLESQATAWNRGDLLGFMNGYWQSEQLTFCSGNTITKGWQATFDRYRKRYQQDGQEMGQLTFDDVQVELLTDDLALVRGRWKLKLTKAQPDGLYTLQVKRFPDGWKVVYDHTSAAEPPRKAD